MLAVLKILRNASFLLMIIEVFITMWYISSGEIHEDATDQIASVMLYIALTILFYSISLIGIHVANNYTITKKR